MPVTDPTPLLIALLQARAEGDDETADELADIMADDEHAAAVLEEAERGGEPEPPADTSDEPTA
jgi:hypothetical protein